MIVNVQSACNYIVAFLVCNRYETAMGVNVVPNITDAWS